MKTKKNQEPEKPKLVLKKMYRWLEVVGAGHIERPSESQPYGYRDRLMFDDFHTEEAAVEALRKEVETEGYWASELILVPVFSAYRDYTP